MKNQICTCQNKNYISPEKHQQPGEHPHRQQENEKPANKWQAKHLRQSYDMQTFNVLQEIFLIIQ